MEIKEQSLMIPIGIVLAVVVAAVGLYMFLPGASRDGGGANALPQGIVLYYGDTCPHCKNVDAYVAAHAIHDKVEFVEKEVYRDRANAAEMSAVTKQCDVGSGVPLLWDGQSCMMGDKDIIAFFAQKAGTPVPEE